MSSGKRRAGGSSRMRDVISLVLACVGLGAAWHFWPAAPVVYVGGPVLTMDGGDRVLDGLAINGDRIAALGTAAEMRAWATEHSARVVELDGHAVLPGFIDAHSHFPGAGAAAISADLSSPPVGSVKTMDELLDRLRAQAVATRPGDWVIGVGYDDTLLAEMRHPERADLDRVSTQHPIVAIHVSAHLAAVNSLGLERLGFRSDTPDPEGGRIRRAADGSPNGVLEETAAMAAAVPLMDPGPFASLRVLRRANEIYSAQGVTTAQNGFATAKMLGPLRWASRLGFTPIRLVVWPAEEAGDAVIEGRLDGRSADPWFHVGAVKLVADGSIQGYTAYLSQPYFVQPPGESDARGYPRITKERLMAWVDRLYGAGRQVAIHGNGDASIDDILDAIEAAQRAHPRPDARPILIHAQTAREDQLDRMAALGVIPSFFVLHTYYWGDRHRDIFLGPERAARISPTASALRRGMRFTLHTDTPIVPMNPLRVVWAAVNRRSTSGREIGPEQRISVLEALKGVTIHAAYQHFQEGDRGSLEVGKLADLVILDRSPLATPDTIDSIRVLETIVGGRSIYRARAGEQAAQ